MKMPAFDSYKHVHDVGAYLASYALQMWHFGSFKLESFENSCCLQSYIASIALRATG